MKIPVRLFAVARELVGCDSVTVNVPAAAQLGAVRQAVEREFPALRPVLPHAMWAVDAAYADEETIVNDNSDVALIPPVSGG